MTILESWWNAKEKIACDEWNNENDDEWEEEICLAYITFLSGGPRLKKQGEKCVWNKSFHSFFYSL